MSTSRSAPRYCCACFYSDNVFIEEYQAHVRYTDPQQFTCDYKRALYDKGCRTPEEFAHVLEKVEKEVQRRLKLGEESLQRRVEISVRYKPLHPELYILQESFLSAEFLSVVRFCESPHGSIDDLLNRLHSIPGKRIYRLPVFIPEFCSDLIEELEHFERSDLPKGRPNSMNNYGVLLNELGFDDTFITPLRDKYLRPITSLLYPDWGGRCLDGHKAFIVRYAMDEDLDLSCHYDNAEVTLNVCLGKEFTEGNLYFSDMKEVPPDERRYAEAEHRIGQGILHRGQHVHGALPIESGERWNLIVWMRASQMMAGDRTKRSRSRSSSISERKSVKKKKSRSRCRHSSSSPSPVRKPSSLAKYHSQSPEYSKKERRKKKSKRRASTSSSETSSSSSSSSSSSDDSSDSESKPKQNKHQRKKAKHRKGKKVKKKSKKAKKNTTKLKKKELKIRTQQSLPGPSLDLCQDQSKDSAPGLTDVQKSRVQAMRPMTKEEWDARQSVIRKVVDPETGRMRLIKGDGEILEEIVSRDRHKEINKQATQNDGLTFQMRSGML